MFSLLLRTYNICTAAKKLISSGILPSGSDTFDDLNDDEPMHEEMVITTTTHVTTTKVTTIKDDTKECFLEDEQEPENLLEGKTFETHLSLLFSLPNLLLTYDHTLKQS